MTNLPERNSQIPREKPNFFGSMVSTFIVIFERLTQQITKNYPQNMEMFDRLPVENQIQKIMKVGIIRHFVQEIYMNMRLKFSDEQKNAHAENAKIGITDLWEILQRE